MALLLFQLLTGPAADGKTRLFGPVLQAIVNDKAVLAALLAAMQRAAHAALRPLGADADPEASPEARHLKLMRLPAALAVLDSRLLQGTLADQPAQLRQLLCDAAGWVARLPPAPPEPADVDSWYGTAWLMAVKLLGKLWWDTRCGFEADNVFQRSVFDGVTIVQAWYPISGHELRAPVTWSKVPAWGRK